MGVHGVGGEGRCSGGWARLRITVNSNSYVVLITRGWLNPLALFRNIRICIHPDIRYRAIQKSDLCRRELAHICMQVGNRRTYNCEAKRREEGTAGKDSSSFGPPGLVQRRTFGPCPLDGLNPRPRTRIRSGYYSGNIEHADGL